MDKLSRRVTKTAIIQNAFMKIKGKLEPKKDDYRN
jgi:hypothetical protein